MSAVRHAEVFRYAVCGEHTATERNNRADRKSDEQLNNGPPLSEGEQNIAPQESETPGDGAGFSAPQRDRASRENRVVSESAGENPTEGGAVTGRGKPAYVSKRERQTFAARMGDAGYVAGRRYDAVKNAFLSYRTAGKKPKTVRARITSGGETFGAGRNLYAKLCLVGGYLRLFLALDPKAYNPQKYHHKDYTEVVRYAKVPLMIKLSSDRQVKNALELIDDVLTQNGFVKEETYLP